MLKKNCLICGKIFIKKKKESATQWKIKIFCSQNCFGLSCRKRVDKQCLICGKDFWVKLSHQNTKYCSHKCSSIAFRGHKVGMTGKHHSDKTKQKISKKNTGRKWSEEQRRKASLKWQGSETKHSMGYILVLKRIHPFANKNGKIRRSHLVAEKCLKRYLTPEEVVHHINAIKNDDRPENLYLFPSKSEHTHFEGLKNKPKLISNLPNI